MPDFSNRLAAALSPYLLQHAGNPVAWQEWGEDAFALARRLDRPIFLSIGYATCHWCHVMAHESFEDEDVAAQINRVFVPVKVDREERPDVDAIYMEACQIMTGQGGWPLTILLAPDGKPFYAATYLPPRARYNRPGVVELCAAVEEAWQGRRAELLEASERLTDALQARRPPVAPGTLPAPGPETLEQAFVQLRRRFDSEWGGWGGAPKFPSPHVGRFLLRYGARENNDEAREMVKTTLTHMRRGGIFDHLGGGFHRYSTDRMWKLPHFEKMLYDQAGLLLLYAEAFHATGEAHFGQTAQEIVAYLTRDLRDEEGAFYAAEDADSEGREGAFYVWTRDQLVEVLGPEDAQRFAAVYNVREEGNFEDEATRQLTGENVLFESAEGERMREDAHLALLRERLFERRTHRPRPLLDDKILTDWNGLVIAALTRAGVLMRDEALVALAERAMRWVLQVLRREDGRLLHRARGGQAGLDAFADDYAFTIWALIELYQATQQPRWLVTAAEFQQDFNQFFWDEEAGAYRLRPHDGEALIAHTIEFYDGATPSANAVAAHNLLRLSRLTGDPASADRARRLFETVSAELHGSPANHTQMLLALDEDVYAPPEVVLSVAEGADAADFEHAFREHARPGSLLVILDAGREEALKGISAHLGTFPIPPEGVRAFVCQNLQCEAPVSEPALLAAQL